MPKILVLDIETTGFLRGGGSIVEVGIVSLNLESGEIATVFDSVCREDILTTRHSIPPMGWIFKNSTLTVEEVRGAPRFEDLKKEIQYHIETYHLGATAYNRAFDFDFLESRGIDFGIKLPCPMKLATPICRLPSANPRYSDYKWPKVEEAWSHFFPDEEYEELHRGADDAMHEARIVLELYRMGVFKLALGCSRKAYQKKTVILD